MRPNPFLFVLFLGPLTLASAQTTLSAPEIVHRAFHPPKPSTSTMALSMTISRGGASISRSLVMWSQGDLSRGEPEKSLLKFLGPADVKGAGFLSIKKAGTTESQLWLPALGRVRRLSSSSADQNSAFFGSDFTNRDINSFAEEDFTYELLGTSEGVYTIGAQPRKPDAYERLVYSISADFVPQKVEFYKEGRVVKSETMETIVVEGYRVPSELRMATASGSTILKFTNHQLNTALGEVFTDRFLKQ